MKILVVDDHVLIREAMRGVLRELKGEAAVILEASDSRQAMRQIEQNPDVELVLLDLGLPDRDGLEMLSELSNRYPTISVVVLSAQQDRDTVMKALDLGALGLHSEIRSARGDAERLQSHLFRRYLHST